MIELNNIHYAYEKAIFQFNLSIRKQERVAILGPSGAGKSTLLNLIAGFIYPDSGEIRLDGQDATHIAPNRRPVSMLFQENNLFTHLTVAQNIGLGIHPSLKLSNAEKQQMQHIAERVGLDSYLTRFPHQLSGGQRQRVAIARCLLQQRPILLLDEPFSSLDLALRLEMLELVESVCEQYQLTLMMVTHNMDDAKQLCSRTLLINHAQVMYDGSTHTLLVDDGLLYQSILRK